jgi:hypothetical protein
VKFSGNVEGKTFPEVLKLKAVGRKRENGRVKLEFADCVSNSMNEFWSCKRTHLKFGWIRLKARWKPNLANFNETGKSALNVPIKTFKAMISETL